MICCAVLYHVAHAKVRACVSRQRRRAAEQVQLVKDGHKRRQQQTEQARQRNQQRQQRAVVHDVRNELEWEDKEAEARAKTRSAERAAQRMWLQAIREERMASQACKPELVKRAQMKRSQAQIGFRTAISNRQEQAKAVAHILYNSPTYTRQLQTDEMAKREEVRRHLCGFALRRFLMVLFAVLCCAAICCATFCRPVLSCAVLARCCYPVCFLYYLSVLPSCHTCHICRSCLCLQQPVLVLKPSL